MRSPRIEEFALWCRSDYGAPDEVLAPGRGGYQALWSWSVQHAETFWRAVWEFFDVPGTGDLNQVMTDGPMPTTRWFPQARVNYVNQVFRWRDDDHIAVIDVREPGPEGGADAKNLSWGEMRRQVGSLAWNLRRLGVARGDRVVAYMPNCVEAVVAFLATASIGAVWASCGQDYAAAAAADRFEQLAPAVLIVTDGYYFAGRFRDCRGAAMDLRTRLAPPKGMIVVDRMGTELRDESGIHRWSEMTDGVVELQSEDVSFNDPLWVLFSSGTTGRPKGIVHGHGGVLIEHLKSLALHMDISREDRFFWYTTPSWMVWNYLVGGLLVGATIVCYDGSPGYPVPDGLFRIAAEQRVSVLGTSPGYLAACALVDSRPAYSYDLSALRIIGSSGSHLPPEADKWIAEQVGDDIAVASSSGGTDVVSSFAGGVPTVPAQPGWLTAPALGVALESWDPEGRAVLNQPGELVITQPMPSMPLTFWRDAEQQQYRNAYFDMFPGVWRHGDWITISQYGAVLVHGRSDSTLNRHGVRMGSSDIYRAVENVPGIVEALVIGAEQPDGTYWMPLFVRLDSGVSLDDELDASIRTAIRSHASPRHVPDDIVEVTAIPHNRTGKKLEIPVKRLLQGMAVEAVSMTTVEDPAEFEFFVAYRNSRLRRDRSGASGVRSTP